jgi:hypothetical protein
MRAKTYAAIALGIAATIVCLELYPFKFRVPLGGPSPRLTRRRIRRGALARAVPGLFTRSCDGDGGSSQDRQERCQRAQATRVLVLPCPHYPKQRMR